MSHFQTSGTFTKKPYKKGLQRFSSWFSFTFCPDFVDLYNKPVVKKVYRTWLRVQNKFLPNEGCLRMFSLFIKDPPSNPRLPYPSLCPLFSLRASSPIWESPSEPRENARASGQAARPLSRASLAQIGELARRLSAILLTYEISKFVIYMSLAIPECSSLHPGLFN